MQLRPWGQLRQFTCLKVFPKESGLVLSSPFLLHGSLIKRGFWGAPKSVENQRAVF